MALRAIGPAARDATPAVIAALKDPQPPIRALAAETLGALQTPPAPAMPTLPGGPEGIDPNAIAPNAAPPAATTSAPAPAVAPAPAPTPALTPTMPGVPRGRPR